LRPVWNEKVASPPTVELGAATVGWVSAGGGFSGPPFPRFPMRQELKNKAMINK